MNKIDSKKLDWIEGNVKGFFGKSLLSLTNGGLKLIKVAPAAHYPEHIHPDKTEYAFVLEGTPELIINAETYSGNVGDFFVFPINTKHSIINKTDSNCVLLIGSIHK